MGSIFAIVASDDAERKAATERLTSVSPYRGQPRIALSTPRLVLGAQLNGQEGGVYVDERIACVLHGYVRSGERLLVGDSAAALLANCVSSLSRKSEAVDGCYCCLVLDRETGNLSAIRTWQNYLPLYFIVSGANGVFATELRQVEAALRLDSRSHRLSLKEKYRFFLKKGEMRTSTQVRLFGPGSISRFNLQPRFSPISSGRWMAEIEPVINRAGAARVIQNSLQAFLGFPNSSVYLFLSGGHDSALIAAAATHAEKQGRHGLHAHYVSAVFPGIDGDESDRIEWISKAFDLPQVIKVDITKFCAWDLFKQQARTLDHPPFPTSGLIDVLLPAFDSSKGAIVITGNGGDEIFCYGLRYATGKFSHYPNGAGAFLRLARLLRNAMTRVRVRIFGPCRSDYLRTVDEIIGELQYSSLYLLAAEEAIARSRAQLFCPYYDVNLLASAGWLMRDAFQSCSITSPQIQLIEEFSGVQWEVSEEKRFFGNWVLKGWPDSASPDWATMIASMDWTRLERST